MSKLPEPTAGFRWNPGWDIWEQVIPAAMREEGVVPMYSEAKVKELLAERDSVLKMALESLNDTCGNRCNAEYNPCHAREAADAIRKVLP